MFDKEKVENILSSIKDTQSKFKSIIVTGKAGDNVDYVAIQMDCNHNIVQIDIAPELIKKINTENGVSLLKSLIMMAHHDVVKKVEQRIRKEMLGFAKTLDSQDSVQDKD